MIDFNPEPCVRKAHSSFAANARLLLRKPHSPPTKAADPSDFDGIRGQRVMCTRGPREISIPHGRGNHSGAAFRAYGVAPPPREKEAGKDSRRRFLVNFPLDHVPGPSVEEVDVGGMRRQFQNMQRSRQAFAERNTMYEEDGSVRQVEKLWTEPTRFS